MAKTNAENIRELANHTHLLTGQVLSSMDIHQDFDEDFFFHFHANLTRNAELLNNMVEDYVGQE